MRILNRSFISLAVASAVIVHPLISEAAGFVGQWDYVSLQFIEVTPGCRYTEKITRAYDLAAAANHTVTGFYTRQVDRAWVGKVLDSCVLPGTHAQPDFMMRIDTWAVNGQYLSKNKRSVSAKLSGCMGDCADVYPLLNFKSLIQASEEALHDEGLDTELKQVVRFRKSTDRQSDERLAAQAFKELLQPLFDGECNLFYQRSLASETQSAISQDKFCAFGRQVGKLMPKILRDEPFASIAPTSSLAPGLARRWSLTDGDVFVQRNFIVDNSGQGVILGGVVRKQSNGTWRVLDLVPHL